MPAPSSPRAAQSHASKTGNKRIFPMIDLEQNYLVFFGLDKVPDLDGV